MARWQSVLIGAAVSAIFVALTISKVDLRRTGDALRSAQVGWLLVTLLFIVAAVVVRCWRWQLLFLPADHVTLRGTIGSTMVGYLLNSVLPGRLGELVRAALISQTDGVSTTRALGTIFVEKLLDVLVLLVCLGTLTLVLPLPEWITAAGVTGSLTFGALALLFFGASHFRVRVVEWASRSLDCLPLIGRVHPSRALGVALGAADAMRHPGSAAAQIGISTFLWGLAAATVWTVVRSFGLDVPWTAAVLVLVTTNLGMTVPSAPASVGVYHWIAVESLRLFDVDPAAALAFALVLHGSAFGSFIIAGSLILFAGLARGEYTVDALRPWRRQAAQTS